MTGVVFLKYWRYARDPLFLAFVAFFGLRAAAHSAVLLLRGRGKCLALLHALGFCSIGPWCDSLEEFGQALTMKLAISNVVMRWALGFRTLKQRSAASSLRESVALRHLSELIAEVNVSVSARDFHRDL